MREILFKAKRVDNGEWVEGYYANCCFPHKEGTGHFIIEYPGQIREIYTKTICQYTGLIDMNGNKIWENDIVKRTDLHSVAEPSIGYLEYDAENTSFLIHWMDVVRYSATYPWKEKIEIIGNIFDNPELVEIRREK